MPSRRAPIETRARAQARHAYAASASGSSCISDSERNATSIDEQRYETPTNSTAPETLSAQRTELQLRERMVQVQEKQLKQEEGLQTLEAEVRARQDEIDTLTRLVKRQDDNATVRDNRWDELRHMLRQLEMDVGARKEQLDSLSGAVKRQGDHATAMDDQWDKCRSRLERLEAELSAKVVELDKLTRTVDGRRYKGFRELLLFVIDIMSFFWMLAKGFIIMKLFLEGVRIGTRSFYPYLLREYPELLILSRYLQRFNEDVTTILLRILQACGLWLWSPSTFPRLLIRTAEDLMITIGQLWGENFPMLQDKFYGT